MAAWKLKSAWYRSQTYRQLRGPGADPRETGLAYAKWIAAKYGIEIPKHATLDITWNGAGMTVTCGLEVEYADVFDDFSIRIPHWNHKPFPAYTVETIDGDLPEEGGTKHRTDMRGFTLVSSWYKFGQPVTPAERRAMDRELPIERRQQQAV